MVQQTNNRYKRWGNEDSEDCMYLKKNYLIRTNSELAADLSRTVDSVRKQMKKLGLKRPKRTVFKSIPKKRGRKPRPRNIFDMVEQGHKTRRKKEKKKAQIKKIVAAKQREKKRVEKEIYDEFIPQSPDLSGKIKREVMIDGKPLIIYASSEEKMRKSINMLKNRHNKNKYY